MQLKWNTQNADHDTDDVVPKWYCQTPRQAYAPDKKFEVVFWSANNMQRK